MNRPTRQIEPGKMADSSPIIWIQPPSNNLEEEKETNPETSDFHAEFKRRKVCNCQENVENNTIETLDDDGERDFEVMNPIISNGNTFLWEFENVNELDEEGMFSDQFNFHNIDWAIEIHTTENEEKYLSIFLHYDNENLSRKNWICETRGLMKLVNQSKNGKNLKKRTDHVYTNLAGCCGYLNYIEWSNLETDGYLKNNSIIIKIQFDFKYYDFSKNIPNITDITINVKGTKFYVNKGMLCTHSKYFFNFFANKNNKTTNIELDDDDDETFVNLIASFYPFFQPVILKNYEKLVQLATKYECTTLHSNCEQFLISTRRIKIVEKLKYADKYNYHELMKSCLTSIKSPQEIKRLEKSALFHSFRESTKLAIMLRILDFF